MDSEVSLPLTGIRVLEVTNSLQGSLAAQVLADLGAEVVRLEPTRSGHQSREDEVVLYGRNLTLATGRSLLRETYNRNKKSLTLDLGRREAAEVLHRLVAKSDVFLTDLLPPELQGLGCVEEALRRYNANLIYARATAFGSKGPDGELGGPDIAGTARSGLSMCIVKGEEPSYPPHALAEVLSGTMLAFGVVTAILARERLGVALPVEASQLGSMMWLQLFGIAMYANKGVEFLRYDRKRFNAVFGQYKCQDGRFMTLGVARANRDWETLCKVMGIEEYLNDLRFDPRSYGRIRPDYNAELVEILDAAFATRPRSEWEEALRTAGLAFSIVNRIPDLLTDTQVIANEYLATLDNGLQLVTLPFQLSVSKVLYGAGSPAIGSDSQDVMVNLCGLSPEDAGELIPTDGA
ncbi:MAG: CoA transferase [Dehalococcoidia bacterium]|nr:CoA transferase [Dehalococcoidia bacterium]